MRGWRGVVGAAALLAVLAGLPGPSAGQEVPGLDRVASLSADGRPDEARSALEAWWDARWSEASPRSRQRALWLRGTLTLDASLARKDYTRLVLEHPGGPYSAGALLRLAQEAEMAGRPLAAARRYDQLLRRYPNSPHRLDARRWLEEHSDVVARARAEREARDAAADSTERGREIPETEQTAASTETGGAEEGGEAEAAGGAAGSGPVAVQLGAFSTVERARILVETARDEGIDDLRLVEVEGRDLVRVRAGRFPDREAAAELRSWIRSRGLDAAIVTDADRESTIR